MIIDKIENAGMYNAINPLLAEGLKFIAENDFSKIEPGKFVLKGDLLYAMVNEYETKSTENCKPEAHKKYIDIQYIVSGNEVIGFQSLNGQQPSEPYNNEKDIVFFHEEGSRLLLEEGHFAIFFPDDIHQPCIMNNTPEHVKKVIVKVAVK